MSFSVYQKSGRAVRLERLGGLELAHETTEHGRAEERGDAFSVTSGTADLPAPERPALPVERLAPELRSIAPQRLVIVSGRARHRFSAGDECREWNDESVRVHVDVVLRPLELAVQLESAHATSDSPLAWHRELLELDEIISLPTAAFPPKERVILEPRACARLIELLAPSGTLRLSQHGAGLKDGDGAVVEAAELNRDAQPPNRARPSYRHPPRFAWMHLALLPGGEVGGHWRAQLITWSGWSGRDRLHADLLLTSGDAWVVARASGSVAEWASSVESATDPVRWYPSPPAGIWGSRVMLDLQRLTRL